MHEQIRLDILELWARTVTRRPWWTLCVCGLLAAAGVILAATQMSFVADRSFLVDPHLGWNARYFAHKDQFKHWDDLIIAIEGPADSEAINELARRIADDLRASDRIETADAGFEPSDASPRLFRAAPPAEFRRRLEQLEQGHELVQRADHANAALAFVLQRLRAANTRSPETPGSIAELARIMTPFLDAAAGTTPDFTALQPDEPDWQPFMAVTGRIRYIQVGFANVDTGIDALAGNIAWLRSRVAASIAEHGPDLPELQWGVTGIPAIEADETAQSISDSTAASILALVLISIVLIIVYRGVQVPLLAVASLLVGLAWSFGWLMLTVGHLQLLSVVFSVILLGLGIDFAVHLVARLELVQDEHADLSSAVSRVFHGIGPGMITGAVTTAVAFGATALTKFRGMAEMGIIAGGGIILCLIAMLSAFPAALQITGRWKKIIRHRHGGEEAHFAHGRLDFVDKRPLATLIAALALAGALLIPAVNVAYDPNVLNLHPPGIESVIWEKRMVEQDGQSVWAGIIHTSQADAPSLCDQLRTHREIGDISGMGLLLPADRAERQQMVQDLAATRYPATEINPDLTTLAQQLAQVGLGLRVQLGNVGTDERGQAQTLITRINAAISTINGLAPPEQIERWTMLDSQYQEWKNDIAAAVDEALSPGPLGPNDLPEVLRDRWIGADGRWLVQASPSADPNGRSILHPQRLAGFVNALFAVSPAALGPPVQIYKSSELIQREYVRAAIYAIIAILAVLLIDFRSLPDALCALMPVGVGFLGMFAVMGMVGMPVNFANIIVMPLICGIGVDAGVHMVHRWRVEPFGEPAGLSGGTGRGITLTMITTCIGFGCMLIAQHRGIRSLGFVMVVGLSVTLLACWMILPAVLRLRPRDDIS